MEVRRFACNPLEVNCYLIWDDTQQCAIIDCGALYDDEWENICAFIEGKGLKPVLSLQTHMHFDHIYGLHHLYRQYALTPICHQAEAMLYSEMPRMSAEWVHIPMQQPLPPLGPHIADGESIPLGNTVIRAIHTPGHTPGGMCYYVEESGMLFSGDTLFCGSIGRSDLPLGDMQSEIDSIRNKLFALPDSVCVYPGHGPSTTIGQERHYNMYLT